MCLADLALRKIVTGMSFDIVFFNGIAFDSETGAQQWIAVDEGRNSIDLWSGCTATPTTNSIRERSQVNNEARKEVREEHRRTSPFLDEMRMEES